MLDERSFLQAVLDQGTVLIRTYKLGDPKFDPREVPWMKSRLHIQTSPSDGFPTLITPHSIGWAEYSPLHDIEKFDGNTMMFVNEEYAMEVKLS